MKLVDVHCHLEEDRFSDIDEVIKRAENAGLNAILVSGVDPTSNRKILKLSKKHSIIKPSFGFYPIDSVISKFPKMNDDSSRIINPFDYKMEIEWIKENKDLCISIGEVGLEFQIIKENPEFEEIKKAQIEVFKDAIELAEEINKPLILHTRGGEKEVIEILEKRKPKIPIVLHCFGGKKSLIKRATENKFYFSIPAVITRLLHFQMLVKNVPISQLLTETDAPYLAPKQGERSEPKDVAITIKEIAKIKNLSEEETANQIWKNFKKVFRFND